MGLALDCVGSVVNCHNSDMLPFPKKRSWASSISWQGALVEGQDGSLMGRLAARIQIADFAPSVSVKRKYYKTKVEMISQPPSASPYCQYSQHYRKELSVEPQAAHCLSGIPRLKKKGPLQTPKPLIFFFVSDFRKRWCWNLTAGGFWKKIIFAFCNGVIFTRSGGF